MEGSQCPFDVSVRVLGSKTFGKVFEFLFGSVLEMLGAALLAAAIVSDKWRLLVESVGGVYHN